jgi:hypothetical protein
MGYTMTVPAKSLAVRNYNQPTAEGKDPEMIQPEPGDPVDFSVKGSVVGIDKAGNATVKVAFVNGERCEVGSTDGQDMPEEADEAANEENKVRGLATEADEEAGLY